MSKQIKLANPRGFCAGVDRAMDGKVTDFFHLEIFNNSFFVFNLADAFITIGAVLIIYFEIIKKLKNE